MNTQVGTASHPSLHPALWVAALSITAFSAVGIARMSGLFDPSAPPAAVVGMAAGQAAPDMPAAVALSAAPEPVAGQPVAPKAKPKPAPVVHVASPPQAVPVKVADRTYDPGIDIVPAPTPAYAPPSAPAQAAVCVDCGRVESVREIRVGAEPSGLGAAAGGLVGGLLGNQVGKGSGRTIATLLGVAGGAYAGHRVEKTQRTTSRWEVGVRLESGEYRAVALDAEPVWQVGDRVQFQEGRLIRPRD